MVFDIVVYGSLTTRADTFVVVTTSADWLPITNRREVSVPFPLCSVTTMRVSPIHTPRIRGCCISSFFQGAERAVLQFIPVEKAEASVNDKDVPSMQADFYNWSSLVSHALAPWLVLYMLKWAGRKLGQLSALRAAQDLAPELLLIRRSPVGRSWS